jgi:hypothetical protein
LEIKGPFSFEAHDPVDLFLRKELEKDKTFSYRLFSGLKVFHAASVFSINEITSLL